MFCRNCKNELNDNSVACIKCGFDPLTEHKFCHSCGAETNEKQVVCVSCGVALKNNPSKTSKSKDGLPNEYDQIYCSSDEKVIFGLCGGLAHKYNVQIELVRVLAVFSGFFMIGWLYLAGLFLPKLPTKNVIKS